MIGEHLPPAEPLVQPRSLFRRDACHDIEHRDTAALTVDHELLVPLRASKDSSGSAADCPRAPAEMSVGRCNVRVSASDWADDRTGRIMGVQADDDPGPGSTPGPGGSLPVLRAVFEHGGTWETAAPSARLVVALAAAAGPGGLYEGAEAGAMVGIV